MSVTIHVGDCREVLAAMPEQSVHCIVTSPPYYGLRDYGTTRWIGGSTKCNHLVNGKLAMVECPQCGAMRIDRQLGLEQTPAAYVEEMVAVFRECRRVLRDDGTLWLNIGDSYAGGHVGRNDNSGNNLARRAEVYGTGAGEGRGPTARTMRPIPNGLKPKDLIGIPWLVAFALRDDGWYLRAANVWAKPNPMPESVRDRTTSSYEMVFMLSKRARYFYDAEAVKDDVSGDAHARRSDGGLNPQALARIDHVPGASPLRLNNGLGNHKCEGNRNLRNVWTIATQPFPGAHFATMPPRLAETCIKAGTSEKGVCPHCGAPWERELGERVLTGGRGAGNGFKREHRLSVGGRGDETIWEPKTRSTIGWRPSCSCPSHKPIPAVILDPFGGAGTTGLVADRLQRNAILIELSEEYASIARKRIAEDKGDILGAIEERGENIKAQQLGMFG